jgi:hypothetical protein
MAITTIGVIKVHRVASQCEAVDQSERHGERVCERSCHPRMSNSRSKYNLHGIEPARHT